jgi:peptidoglycan/LPS O-acetylase OafA/YrhL
MSRAAIPHQPALDGVRGVAVAVVLLFHAGVTGFDGGYLGVSIFFTLSGYLITSLLLAEHDTEGRIGLGAFYARRARRLLPASLLCVAVIVIADALTDWFVAVDTIRRDALGAVLQIANWVFLAGDGSYQDLVARSAGQASPFEHYWSLAVEEQFYWLWPVVFLVLTQVAGGRWRTHGIAALTAVAVVAAPVIAVVWGPDAVYWATPARLSEILLGVLVAALLHRRPIRLDVATTRRWAWAAPTAAVALGVAIVTFPTSGGPAYSGWLPAIGVASALLVVGLQVPGPVRSALSVGPLTWLGRISYGVYLFHWPVFVVLDQRRTGLDGGGVDTIALLAVRLVVTLAIAQASFTLFEQPIRRGLRWPDRRVGSVGLATTAAVAALVVVVASAPQGSYWAGDAEVGAADDLGATGTGTLPPLVAPPNSTTRIEAPATTATAASGTEAEASTAASGTEAEASTAASGTETEASATTGAPPISATTTTTIAALPALARPVRILVAGDSTAEATATGLAAWSAERPDLAVVGSGAELGCGFVRGGDRLLDPLTDTWESVPTRCDTWLDAGLPAAVAESRPDVVLLLTTSWDVLDRRWDGTTVHTPLDAEYADRVRTDFAEVTTRLLDAGAGHVVWAREPIPNVFWWSSGQAQEQPERHAVLYAVMDELSAADPTRVSVVDLAAWIDDEGLATDQDARPDGVHWSPEASARIAREFLGDAVIRAALGI